jgi:ABC-type taurine transport system ATPase subunit
MSPRPGRIVARLPVPFARGHAAEGIRAVKSRADFVAAREEILSLIWAMGNEL